METLIPNDFTPRDYQEDYFEYYDAGGKRGMWCWHRRAGKDLTAANQECKQMHIRIGNYWHFFPTMEQGRRGLWEHIRADGKKALETVFPGFTDPKLPGGIVKRKQEQHMMIELHNGSIWRVMGTDKLESVGAGPVHVTFSEFSLCRPTAWDFVRPMLRENGGSASFIFTPRGRNHAHRMWELAKTRPGWRTSLKTVKDTGLTFPSEADPDTKLTWQEMLAEEKASGMLPELIDQEYMCDFTASLVGSYYGALIHEMEQEGRIWAFEHDVTDVHVSMDIGISDSYTMWAFRENGYGGLDFLAYYENHGQPVSHYVNKLVEWATSLKFRYAAFHLPHDARARELGTGQTVIEHWLKHTGNIGWPAEMTKIVEQASIQDGIEAVRWVLMQPTRIHTRCEAHDGIELLRQYRRAYDEEKRVFSDKPEHDWTSHGADGLRYGCLQARTIMKKGEKHRAKKILSVPVARPFDKSMTLDGLWKYREREQKRRRRNR